MRPYMKLLVLGGTGATGREIVSQALAAGHDVTLVARASSTVPSPAPKLRVVRGELDQARALTDAVTGHDVVLSALGRGLSFTSEHLMERSVPHILSAMKAAGVRRLIFLSALGVGETYQGIPIGPKIFVNTLLRGICADKLVGDSLIRQSGLDWTLVHPAQLTNGPRTGQYRWGERLALTGLPAISRADTAHFIIDHLTDAAIVGKTIVLAT
jgi:putative NADH-flavin reductase